MPDPDIARRIAALEARHSDVMIWAPEISITGRWEAAGDGWTIKDARMAAFCRRVEAKLAGQPPAAEQVCALCHKVLSQCRCMEPRAAGEAPAAEGCPGPSAAGSPGQEAR